MVQIVCAVVTALSAIVVAIIGTRFKANSERYKQFEEKADRREEKADRRAEKRQEEATLILKMLEINLKQGIVCSNALTGGHNNGNVEEARIAAEDVLEEYNEYVRASAAKQISKH